MKSTHKTQKFDYNKIEEKNNPNEYWKLYGFHAKNSRLQIDTKRLKK